MYKIMSSVTFLMISACSINAAEAGLKQGKDTLPYAHLLKHDHTNVIGCLERFTMAVDGSNQFMRDHITENPHTLSHDDSFATDCLRTHEKRLQLRTLLSAFQWLVQTDEQMDANLDGLAKLLTAFPKIPLLYPRSFSYHVAAQRWVSSSSSEGIRLIDDHSKNYISSLENFINLRIAYCVKIRLSSSIE